MLIVFGTKYPRTTLGLVAELCPGCSEITAHTIDAIEKVGHIYWIPAGPRALTGHVVTCKTCGREDAKPAVERYTWIEENVQAVDLAPLIRKTNPGVVDEQKAEQDLRARAASGQITSEERVQLMERSFAEIARLMEAPGAKPDRDALTWLALLGSILATILALGWALSRDRVDLLWIVGMPLGVMLLGLGAVFYASSGAPTRFIRKRLAAPILVAIREYAPSHDEIDSLVDRLRASKTRFGRKLDRDWLIDLADRTRAGRTDFDG